MEVFNFVSGRTNRQRHTIGLAGPVYRTPSLRGFNLKGEPNSTDADTNTTVNPNRVEAKEPPRYYCKQCDTPVAFVGDENKIGDTPTLSAHLNPHGFVHEVLTIRFVQNCILYGDPTPADSWFPGFFWLYCFCQRCHAHLGWAYFRPNRTAYSFVGLRRPAIRE